MLVTVIKSPYMAVSFNDTCSTDNLLQPAHILAHNTAAVTRCVWVYRSGQPDRCNPDVLLLAQTAREAVRWCQTDDHRISFGLDISEDAAFAEFEEDIAEPVARCYYTVRGALVSFHGHCKGGGEAQHFPLRSPDLRHHDFFFKVMAELSVGVLEWCTKLIDLACYCDA